MSTGSGWVNSKTWMVASLVIVCVTAAFALSRVYLVTKPVIQEQKELAVKNALGEVLPAAASFNELEPGTLWYGLDSESVKVGIIIMVAPRGYAGPVEVMVGVDLEGKVTGIRVASPAEGLKETPGLGLKARDDRFQDQFHGRVATDIRLKRDGGTIDAISAATITSRAVANGIREGIEQYAEHLKP
jgi:electron transport complex protein RnfG